MKLHAMRLGSDRFVLGATLLACLLLTAPAARAGLVASAGPTFPSDVTVGDTAVPVSIEVRNDNTPPNVANTVCNVGDAFPCPLGDPGITMIASCGQLGVFSVCTPAGADPGVFAIPATATGGADTACAGTIFDVAPIDPAFGQHRFTPQGGEHVVLPAPGTLCRISFAVDVLKLPVVDQQPDVDGIQTIQIVDNTQRSTGSVTASGRGTSTGVTVAPAPPPCEPSAPGTCDRYGRGSATITALAPATGCRRRPFRVYVRGTFVDGVDFAVDGRRIARRSSPNWRDTRYSVWIRPSGLRAGTHRLVARTRFASVAGTGVKQLRLTFRVCDHS
jgi:hypothetical protein